MTTHKTGTREELLAGVQKLQQRQEELDKMNTELTEKRRELPWVPVKKEYILDTDEGPKTLAELFDGRSQLVIYQIMFGTDWTAACPGCSTLVDDLDPMVPHLNGRDVTLMCVSHAPLKSIQAMKKRMGWRLPYASSFKRDFNYDFGGSVRPEDQEELAKQVLPQFENEPSLPKMAAACGIDVKKYVTTEAPGLNVFAIEPDGTVYHTFTSTPQGGLHLGYEQYLDRTPKGGQDEVWARHHDEYPAPAGARGRN